MSTPVKTVFVDVDTQNDFLYPEGALYVPGAETIVETIAALNHHAAAHGIPVISTTDAHSPDDAEFADWPRHCVVGTEGQLKPRSTVLSPQITVTGDERLEGIAGASQILVEKQKLDCFSNPRMAELITLLNADRYVIYGVVTEVCVRLAALGILTQARSGTAVEVVADAVRHLDEKARDQFFAEFTSAGGKLMSSAQVTG